MSQSRHDLLDDNSVFQEISENAEFVDVGSMEVPVRTYMASFNLVGACGCYVVRVWQHRCGLRPASHAPCALACCFPGAVQQKRVASLSGGERGRVHLAKVLKDSPNVLLLDEPTNDLGMWSVVCKLLSWSSTVSPCCPPSQTWTPFGRWRMR